MQGATMQDGRANLPTLFGVLERLESSLLCLSDAYQSLSACVETITGAPKGRQPLQVQEEPPAVGSIRERFAITVRTAEVLSDAFEGLNLDLRRVIGIADPEPAPQSHRARESVFDT